MTSSDVSSLGETMHSSRSVRRGLVALVIAMAFIAGACGSSSDSSSGDSNSGPGAASDDRSTDVTIAAEGPPKVGGTLTYALAAESDGWNPTKNRWSGDGTMVGLAIYDPLAAFDENAVAQPYLAEAFTPSSDFMEWTITLRSGVTFQDGSPLDASVLKTIFETHLASPLTAPALGDLDTVTATGPLTAVFKMKAPWATFPSSLTGQLGMVPSPATLADESGTALPIGTGPFEMTDWQTGDTVTTVKNDSYWRTDESGVKLPYLGGVTFKVVPEFQTKINAVITGDVDMASTSVPEGVIPAREAADKGEIQLVENNGETEEAFVMLNALQAPFDSLTARQAMAYATDQAAYIAAVDLGNTQPLHTVFREGTPFYKDSPYPEFDLEKATDLVKQYEQESGQSLAFTLRSDSTAQGSQQAQFLKALYEAAGMKVDIKLEDQATLIISAVTGDYQATTWGQFGSPDPDYDYLWWISDNAAPKGELGLNIARNKDDQIDAALKAARSTTDLATRQENYGIVSDRLNEDLPYIWLARGHYITVATNEVRGITQGPLPDGQPSYPQGGPGGFANAIRLTQTWLTS
jgi:peptide/nickel transport system substrate-binding protein